MDSVKLLAVAGYFGRLHTTTSFGAESPFLLKKVTAWKGFYGYPLAAAHPWLRLRVD